jgi:hypothetical protein
MPTAPRRDGSTCAYVPATGVSAAVLSARAARAPATIPATPRERSASIAAMFSR